MSRKMIDYQVEGNKISTIDGYKVGGDELTGDALMGITKDSTTITRTLDTDGKVKFDTKGDITTKQDKLYTKTNSGITLTEESGKSYIGSEIIFTDREIRISSYYPNKAYNIGDTYAPSTAIDDTDAVIVGAQITQLPSLINVGGESGPTFSASTYYSVGFKGSKQRVYIRLTCIKAGTISDTAPFDANLYLTLIKNAKYQYFA